MPTYAYACTACEHSFEIVQSFTDDSLTRCPECEGRLRKLFNAVGVVFKGSGFYSNDSRSDSRKGLGKGSGKSARSGSGAESGSASSSESGSSSADFSSSTSSDPSSSRSSDSRPNAGTKKAATKTASAGEGSAA